MADYELLVIGAGPGGYTAALRAAKLGMKTALVEKDALGGTCLNRGCIPTKTLLHSAQVYQEAKKGAAIGVCGESVGFNLEQMFAHKEAVSAQLREGIASLLKSAKVDCITGTAQITAPGAVTVTAQDGTAAAYTASNILIATGSGNARPPIPGLDLAEVVTSDELLQGSDPLVSSLVILGGGVIGVELATFYAALGCHITIIEGLDRLLPNLDRELGQNLQQQFKKQGIEVYTGANIQSLERVEGGIAVHALQKGNEKVLTGEKVLCALGRRASFDGLFAEGLTPALRGRSLQVDDRFQTSIPGIYAVGDVSSQVQLAHVAAAQGEACAEMLAGKQAIPETHLIPSAIYCIPEIASVGLTEAQAKEQEVPVAVGKCTLYGNARTIIEDPGRSFVKLVAHKETHKLLGAHLMCSHASDMISQMSQAILSGLTAEELRATMRPHPSFEETVTDALENLIEKLA